MVLEMIPRPRVWQWSLARLRKRCKLAPQAAIVDICILVDEMIADMNIFSGPDQRILLQRLAHNPQVIMEIGNLLISKNREPNANKYLM